MIAYRTTGSFRSLAVRENLDGTLEVEALALSGATAKTPCPVAPGVSGYCAYPALSSATGAWFMVGVPKETLASAEWGTFIVGGFVTSVTFAGSVTGTANLPLIWASASGLIGVAASCSGSMMVKQATGTMACGLHKWQAGYESYALNIATATVLTSSGLATTEHNIYLWGNYITGI